MPQRQKTKLRTYKKGYQAQGVGRTRSRKGANSKAEKKQRSSEATASAAKSQKDPLRNITSVLVHFLMHMHKMKKPVTKAEMLKLMKKKYKGHFPEILKRATFTIEIVFGVDLKEVDSAKESYVLVSKMDLPNNGTVTRGKGYPKTGLLMNLLGLIFLKGNRATEEDIWEFLNKMRVFAGQKHFIFGEPKKLITQLVKLKYLECRQIPNSDPARYEFLWGPRALAETSKMRVLEYWAMVNHRDPRTFHSWYEEALRDEEERIQNAVRSSVIAEITEPENVSESDLVELPTFSEAEFQQLMFEEDSQWE
ncbi:melanoma-associated antigen B3-like [Nycticebus coucang]|uniref:melanoma-associated antigen B3-like n=1 Tax=Nycticebus coucang TaxID=9470 RepID=UPI00234CCB8F|nr:melanoma-associated antigen B3-like [Nycticebus coucang]